MVVVAVDFNDIDSLSSECANRASSRILFDTFSIAIKFGLSKNSVSSLAALIGETESLYVVWR